MKFFDVVKPTLKERVERLEKLVEELRSPGHNFAGVAWPSYTNHDSGHEWRQPRSDPMAGVECVTGYICDKCGAVSDEPHPEKCPK